MPPVYGDDAANELHGTANADTIFGLGGDDTIVASPGHDLVDGGDGYDILRVEPYDRATFPADQGARTYVIGADRVTDDAGNLDTSFTDIETVSIYGGRDPSPARLYDASQFTGSGGVTIFAAPGEVGIVGSAFDDRFSLRAGPATLDGGAGTDSLTLGFDGEAGTVTVTQDGDTVIFNQNDGIQRISNVESFEIFSQAEDEEDEDPVTIDASAVSTGMIFHNSDGIEQLIGGAGEDRFELSHYTYGDRYTGGDGADLFRFNNILEGGGPATITDLQVGDRVELKPGWVGGSLSFIGNAAFSGHAGEYRYTTIGTSTQVNFDRNGDGRADFSILFANGSYALAETAPGSNVLVRGADVAGPLATADSYNGVEDTALVVGSASGVLRNDASGLTARLVTGSAHGELVLNADGSFVYRPAADYHGTDSFSYAATDALGNVSAPVAVTIEVAPVNDAPTNGADRAFSTIEETAVTVSAENGLLAGAADPDGDTLAAIVVDGPRFGAITIGPDGAFVYTPVPDYVGSDSFTYLVRDGSGAESAVATIQLTIASGGVTIIGTDDANVVSTELTVPGQPRATRFDDTLHGLGGDDTLDGSAGDDLMLGGRGDDTYVVRDAGDQIVEKAGEGTDTVRISVDYKLSANLENLVLFGTQNLSGTGNNSANSILGNIGDNVLNGGRGDDTVEGGAGDDRLIGGRGTDTLSYASATGGVVVSLALKTAQDTHAAGIDTVSDFENLLGSSHDDRLTGNSRANALFGGKGDDTLTGGRGQDALTGGRGGDIFVFAAGDSSASADRADHITDFRRFEGDKIDLSGIDAVEGGADDAFTFIGRGAFSGTAGELRYYVNDGATYAAADTDGDRVAELVVRLDRSLALQAGDFVL